MLDAASHPTQPASAGSADSEEWELDSQSSEVAAELSDGQAAALIEGAPATAAAPEADPMV